ncbi:hypothetical protein F4553_003479 [Allocatelliglobosispora scoriae]|uniref:Choice-of-anchor D domain-containing protein n=1 Tax=Allocatelliglobosispora scoriae TaxID=643052 RepID=A0A841BTJ0_9ACTN|nr:choice-of-anchor D domain-containing protein [Allocatelliglobosispora scoriae]MBB5870100.1 hypothetical protein [Allocatelliglobosispora scoriae]
MGALALALTALSPVPAAQAAASDTHDVITAGTPGWVHVVDHSNGNLQFSMRGDGGFSLLGFPTDSSAPFLMAVISPPTGSTLTTGTYQGLRSPDATHAGVDVTAGTGCNESTGSMTVHEISRDAGTNAITSVAISYQTSCSDLRGELRWHSTYGFQAVSISPQSLVWDSVNVGESADRTVTITSMGTEPFVFGVSHIVGADAASFSLPGSVCFIVTLNYGESCSITVRAKPLKIGAQSASLVIDDNTAVGHQTIPMGVSGLNGAKGTYYAAFPARLLDTRTGKGAPKAMVQPGATVRLQVTGRESVPAAGVGAVVLNVTVVGPTSSGYLTVFPTGASKPTASSLNFAKGKTRANSVTVAVGTDGKIDIFNSAGSTHILVDVAGYYASDNTPLVNGAGGQFQPTQPQRLFDSRSAWHSMLPGDAYVLLPVNYGAAINSHIRALVVNITAVTPKADGFITAWSGSWGEPPATSTLNYAKGSVVPNQAIVETIPCDTLHCGSGAGLPSIAVYSQKDTHLLVDIVGFIDDGTLADGLRFQPRTPTRIVDTRTGLGWPFALTSNDTALVETPTSLLPPGTEALAVNATAVAPTGNTYVTLWPQLPGQNLRPNVSNLNAAPGQTVANAAITLIGPDNGAMSPPRNAFLIYNFVGTTHVLVDLVGTFWLYPGTASSPAPGAGAAKPSRPTHSFVAPPAVLRTR